MAKSSAHSVSLAHEVAEAPLPVGAPSAWWLPSVCHMRWGLSGSKAGTLLGTSGHSCLTRVRYYRGSAYRDRQFFEAAQAGFCRKGTPRAGYKHCCRWGGPHPWR
ncbi:hypothetical protein ES703_98382 [subsurface metagenome]